MVLTSGAVVVSRRGRGSAKHTAGPLIIITSVPKATGTHRWNAGTDHREASESVFFNFFSSFVSLSLSLLLSPSIMLCRTPCTISGRGEKKRRRKVGQGDLFFFPTVHGGRGWRCYRQLDEEQGLMGRQGLVARRSHSELGQQQRLRLVNGLSYWGEKLQMNHRLYAPSWALRSLLTPQPHTSKNTRTYKPYSSAGVSEALPPPISSSLPLSVSSNSVWLLQSDLTSSKPEPHRLLNKGSFHISLSLTHGLLFSKYRTLSPRFARLYSGQVIYCTKFNCGLEMSNTDAYSAAMTSLHIICAKARRVNR